MKKLKKSCTEDEINALIAAADINNDGEISFGGLP